MWVSIAQILLHSDMCRTCSVLASLPFPHLFLTLLTVIVSHVTSGDLREMPMDG